MVGLSAMFPRVEVFLIQGSPVDMLERPPMDGKRFCDKVLFPYFEIYTNALFLRRKLFCIISRLLFILVQIILLLCKFSVQ